MLSLNKEGKSQHDDEEPRGATQNGNQPPTGPYDYRRHARDDLASPLLLGSIGWVVGGPPTVVRALLHVLRERRTLVMPAATPHCTDPATWSSPRVPEAWLAKVREHLPIFDPQTTPTARGAICETFRTWPNTLTVADIGGTVAVVARRGDGADGLCARGVAASASPLGFSEGRGGPFEKLYDLDCRVLLLGVGFNRCTALHFAESLLDKRRVKTVRFPVVDNGLRVWTEVLNVGDDNDTHFPVIGHKCVSTEEVRQGTIGDAQSMLSPMRGLVDFAVSYFHDVL